MKKKNITSKCEHEGYSLYWVCNECNKVFEKVSDLDLLLCGYIKADMKEIEHHIKKENIKEAIKPKKTKFKLAETRTVVRRESGLLEYICPHGVGHPLFASATKVAKKHKHNLSSWLTHGCDGCCKSEEFQKINKNYTER